MARSFKASRSPMHYGGAEAMKELVKVALSLMAVFATFVLVLKLSGVISSDDIVASLSSAQHQAPWVIGAFVVILLIADLFISVPTMTTAALAGYFLGWPLGAAAVTTGLFAAGLIGFGLSRRFGTALLRWFVRDSARLDEIHRAFDRYGPWVLVTCRAVPILPEVSFCLAGATGMELRRFVAYLALGTLPYAAILTYAGSVSTPEKPLPAIVAATGLALTLWTVWYILARRSRTA